MSFVGTGSAKAPVVADANMTIYEHTGSTDPTARRSLFA